MIAEAVAARLVSLTNLNVVTSNGPEKHYSSSVVL